ncbi:MAG TPA: hypothetical protein VMO17_09845 [Terriglobia bacterium]|nr:hypothetical protein [Terriglobia bacterium]
MSLKGDQLLLYGVQYATYILEVCVIATLAWKGRWRRLKGLGLYVASLFLLDGVARPAVSNFFGHESKQFFYFYWTTDLLFALGAFLVICGFFRRACCKDEKLWSFIRLLLIFVFPVVLGVTALSFTRHYTDLKSNSFVIEFSQNLYFACLVLNTFLYLTLQQLAIEDDELGLLVCGLGVQFAGEAAGFAFLHLMNNYVSQVLITFVAPGCTLAMLWIWVYAIGKTPQTASEGYMQGGKEALVEVLVDP